VVDPQRLRVEVQIDESDIARVAVGQTAMVTFDALRDHRFAGTVTSLSPTGSSSQGVVQYPSTIELSQAHAVRPGMTATATITVAQKESAVLVPNRAIRKLGPESLVEVSTPNGTETRRVQIGINNEMLTEVTAGLNEGEQVVVNLPGGTVVTTSGNADKFMMPVGGGPVPAGGAAPGVMIIERSGPGPSGGVAR